MLMSLMMAKKDKGRERSFGFRKADVQTTLSCLENIPFCLSVRPSVYQIDHFLKVSPIFFCFSLTNRSTQITNCCCCYWCLIQRSKYIYRYSRQVSKISAHSTARNVSVFGGTALVSQLWQTTPPPRTMASAAFVVFVANFDVSSSIQEMFIKFIEPLSLVLTSFAFLVFGWIPSHLRPSADVVVVVVAAMASSTTRLLIMVVCLMLTILCMFDFVSIQYFFISFCGILFFYFLLQTNRYSLTL